MPDADTDAAAPRDATGYGPGPSLHAVVAERPAACRRTD
ncbi:hypothetical protein FHS37_001289 [Streptomyces griseostramineus]|uniref:Uncharacterized protein n=1 Tax=Streptomyces griseomycini TaxID=66895 RepID=A0A7W7LWA3_9ACTN|nr:hypothetical protein [Streptomyces griseomycini]